MINRIKKVKIRQLLIVIFITIFLGLLGFFVYSREFSVLPDASVSIMRDIKDPVEGDRVLIFSPHPDDETICTAGYIQRAVKNKAEVKVVLITDGNRRGIGEERMNEFEESLNTLGLEKSDYKYLNLPEFYLDEKVDSLRLTGILGNEIEEFDPNIIFYPSYKDKNPDHEFIGEVTNSLLRDKDIPYGYAYLVHWNYFPRPIGLKMNYNMTPPVKLLDLTHDWQRFMLTPEEQEVKLSAVLSYKSQLKKPILHNLLMGMVRKNELFYSTQND